MLENLVECSHSYLLTHWGGILDYDRELNEVRARPFDGKEPDVRVVLLTNGSARFELRGEDGSTWLAAEPGTDGKLHAGTGAIFPNKILYVRVGPHPDIYAFKINGLFLSTKPEGLIRFHQTRAITWERYLLLDETRFAQAAFIKNNHWFSPAQDDLISSESITFCEEMKVRIGKIVVSLTDLLDSAGKETFFKSLRFSHAKWRQDSLILYRPLVYFCSFGKEEGFRCLDISVKSLRKYGKYDGAIAVLTERSDDAIERDYPDTAKEVTLLPYLPLDAIDYMSARFDISMFEYFDHYQPVLYLDTDIIIQNELSVVFEQAIRNRETLFHVTKETSEPMDEPYYGRELFQEDESVTSDPAFGFTTGILLFIDNVQASPTLRQVRNVIIQQSEMFDGRNIMRCFDQPAANYVLHKLEKPSPDILTANVRNFDMGKRHVPDEELEEYCCSIEQFPILHFAGGVGAYDWKLDAMIRYSECLETLHSD